MVWRNDQVSRVETEKILKIARSLVGTPGDFVEMGCYKGDTALLLAEVLEKGVAKEQQLFIYDSFEGLPEKGLQDESVVGENFRGGELAVSKREVKERFLRAGLKVPVIKKAWFSELTGADLPEEIAFAFLDGDFYQSIKDSLGLVGPRMVPGGVIVVHDFANPALPGVAKAVKEWMNRDEYRAEICQSMIIMEKSDDECGAGNYGEEAER